MELVDAILGRRSIGRLVEPAPTDDEVVSLVATAATGPDHGRLRPWRLIFVREEARYDVGQALSEALAPDDEAGRVQMAAKPSQAPLLLAIVFAPQANPVVPEWEQLAAASAMLQNLMLMLRQSGWDSKWRTGHASRAEPIRKLLQLEPTEQALGFLYVGTSPSLTRPPRRDWDPRPRLSMLKDGDIVPIG
jgi:nitroreductase